MSTANITPEVETLTPEQFVARVYSMCDSVPETPTDYFIRNLDTGKVELHIAKATYSAFSAEDKQNLWDSFRWSRSCGCWISRGLPCEDFSRLESLAAMVGLTDGGYFVTLTLDNAGSSKVEPAAVPAPAPAKPAAPVKAAKQPAEKPAAKAEHSNIVPLTPRKYFTGTIGTDEIEHALRHGSGFAGGKIRIMAFFAGKHTLDEGKKFLKEEYGIGGSSHTFANGASGFLDYDGSGMKIRSGFNSEGSELKLSWVSVASYLHTMVREGRYLTDEEYRKYNEVVKRFHGKVPAPRARFGWAGVDET